MTICPCLLSRYPDKRRIRVGYHCKDRGPGSAGAEHVCMPLSRDFPLHFNDGASAIGIHCEGLGRKLANSIWLPSSALASLQTWWACSHATPYEILPYVSNCSWISFSLRSSAMASCLRILESCFNSQLKSQAVPKSCFSDHPWIHHLLFPTRNKGTRRWIIYTCFILCLLK